MKTSNKHQNKKSADPIDKLIFEKGLRLKHLMIDRQLDLLVVILNNGSIIKTHISDFPRLKNANPVQINNWSLAGKGIAIEWKDLDENLSLKGFIKSAMLNDAIQKLAGNGISVFA